MKNKNIAITGGCGTVGRELVKQIAAKNEVRQLLVMDNNETELFMLEEQYKTHKNFSFLLTDIRDEKTLADRLEGIDILFHTAALKHVIICEKAPFQPVKTNVLGVENVIRAAQRNELERVIFTSSDKAVNPTNVMGASKLLGERLISAANVGDHKTIFSSTRFGNVLGSRGSVIPVFKKQIKDGGPVTLTDPEMTRFIMSIQEAVRLVVDSVEIACGGEVFVTKMPVLAIRDLAAVMIEEMAPRYGYSPEDIKINIIGSKPGEKLYEELMTNEETARATELKQYFAIRPAFLPNFKEVDFSYRDVVSTEVHTPYVSASEPLMSKDEIRTFLLTNDLLDECI